MRDIIKKILIFQYKKRFSYFCKRAFKEIHPGNKLLWNWHLDVVTDILSSIFTLKKRKIIINMPPRYLKSFCVSVAFPAWLLAIDPSKKVIVSTYSGILSKQHATDCRKIMLSDWYQSFFPDSCLKKGSNTNIKFGTEHNGRYFAACVNGTLTGEGGDVLILDDPHNALQVWNKSSRDKVKKWFFSSFLSRLNKKDNGVIIVVAQRLHDDDLIAELKKFPDWELLSLPALANKEEDIFFQDKFYYHRSINEPLHKDFESFETLKDIQKNIGDIAFSSQYQQEPVFVNGNLFKEAWMQFYSKTELQINDKSVFISIDCASMAGENNDWSVIAVFVVNASDFYILEIIREKVEYPKLKKIVTDVIGKYSPQAVLIENRSNGSSLIQELQSHNFKNIISIEPKFSKIVRFNYVISVAERRCLFFPKGEPFLVNLINELTAFPLGKNDDQVDAISQFIYWHNYSSITKKSTIKVRSIKY